MSRFDRKRLHLSYGGVRLSALDFLSAPDEALELARHCDNLACYERFWVGEHHSDSQVPDPLAFALVAAGRTARIRIGTGAISLHFRHPYLIAETALMSELLYPGRLDLGVSRSIGADPVAARAIDRLVTGSDRDALFAAYDARLTALRDVLLRQSDGAFLGDRVRQGPPLYVMCRNQQRAEQAGRLGIGLVASFHHGGTPASIRANLEGYRAAFAPSALFQTPFAIVVISGFVSNDAVKIERAARAEREFGASPAGRLAARKTVIASPPVAVAEILALAQATSADEMMFLCLNREGRECHSAIASSWPG